SARGGTLEGVNVRGLDLLLSPDGRRFLDSLPPYEEQQALALGSALRKQGMDADLVAAALTQSRLRAKAGGPGGKFGEFAANMLFTVDGLERATRREGAALHARRYAQGGTRRVGDLGCRTGGDWRAVPGPGCGGRRACPAGSSSSAPRTCSSPSTDWSSRPGSRSPRCTHGGMPRPEHATRPTSAAGSGAIRSPSPRSVSPCSPSSRTN